MEKKNRTHIQFLDKLEKKGKQLKLRITYEIDFNLGRRLQLQEGLLKFWTKIRNSNLILEY